LGWACGVVTLLVFLVGDGTSAQLVLFPEKDAWSMQCIDLRVKQEEQHAAMVAEYKRQVVDNLYAETNHKVARNRHKVGGMLNPCRFYFAFVISQLFCLLFVVCCLLFVRSPPRVFVVVLLSP